MASREESLNALKEVLEAVEGIKLVSREFKGIDEIGQSQFPCLMVLDDIAEEELDYKTNDFANIDFEIRLVGYVKTKATSTALNTLDVSAKKALGTDFLLSTGIMRTAGLSRFRINGLTERSGAEFHPMGWFERTISLSYEGRLSTGL